MGYVSMPVRPTGYCYFGWVLPGSDSAYTEFGSSKLDVKTQNTHLSGQVSDDNIIIAYTGAIRHILAEFTATGLYELFHLKASDWTNICALGSGVNSAMREAETHLVKESQHIALDDISAYTDLFSSVLIVQSTHAIFAPSYVSTAVTEIEQCNGIIQLTDLAEKLTVSSRQLNRKFTEVVGISPKHFAQIRQINRVVRAMLENDTNYFTEIAHAYGFYDQSHLIKATQKFLGSTPLEFLQSDEEVLFTFLGKQR